MRSTFAFIIVILMGGRISFAQGPKAPPESRVETRKERITVKKKHDVVVANTLWDLAAYYYKDPWKWPRIYEANKDKIKDPHWIYPNQILIIPGLEKVVMVVHKLPVKPPPPPPPPPKPVPPPPPPPPPEKPYRSDEGPRVAEALSVDLPRGMTGQSPAMYRMRFPTGWTEDGRVMEFHGREAVAAAGDYVSVRIEGKVEKRQRYAIYRPSGPTEADRDGSGNIIEGVYVTKMGLLQVVRRQSTSRYRARILNSGGSIQLGDFLKLEN